MALPMFYTSETGINNANYDDTHSYEFGFTSSAIQIHFKTGTGPILFSFNGTDDHGELNNTTGSIQTQILEPFSANKIWLKGGDGTEVIEISALPRL